MNNKILLGVGALFALTACPGTTVCDSGDSVCESAVDSGGGESGTDCEAYTGATYLGFDSTACDQPAAEAGVPAVGWNCDATDYWYDFYTVGWTGGGYLWIYQTGSTNPWNEEHTVPVLASSEKGHWDNLYLQVAITDDYTQVEDGVKTLYACDGSMETTLTWLLEVYDTSGTTLADCAVWGDDPAELGTACDDWN
ncbi:MAG: hypothetical protein GY913_33180 [Proteobacteria bacterium]|nr:hypothetical protein [Pseudomonadota bacterium]MCP4921779.1 hypothetical protein [Pseudomonadota bacterium]